MKHPVFILLLLFTLILCCSSINSCRQPERSVTSSATGMKQKWIFRATERIRSAPLYVENRVIVRTDSNVVAIDSGSGKVVWSVPAGNITKGLMTSSPEGEILVFSADGDYALQAVETNAGSILWRKSGSVFAIAADSENVYVGRDRNSIPVQAFHLSNGESIWLTDSTVPQGSGTYYIFAQGDRLVVFTRDNLYELDRESGKVQRSLENFLGGGTNVTLIGNQVFMWHDQKLRVKDSRSGELVWEADVDPFYYSIISDRVFVASRCCALTALNSATGRSLWQMKLDVSPVSKPVAIDNIGYVILNDASILGFDLETGEGKGKIETQPAIVNPEGYSKGLATDGVQLFATFGDNTLVAFGK